MNALKPIALSGLVWLAGCGDVPEARDEPPADETSATSRALEELSAAYDELAGLVDGNPGEAVQWAQEDFGNLGDWEYRVIEISGLSSPELEAELNALGEDRWEVYWVEPVQGGRRIFLKRSAVSYLSRVPLAALLRVLGGNGQ